jgi:hypothetical protein
MSRLSSKVMQPNPSSSTTKVQSRATEISLINFKESRQFNEDALYINFGFNMGFQIYN